MHPRQPNVRVAAETALEAALVLRLDLVVELLGDPFAHLGQDSTGIDAGRQALQDRADEAEIAQIGFDRLGHVGALDLDRDLRSVVRARAMDLPQGRDRERVLLEVAEQLADGRVELALENLADATEGDGLRALAQRAERAP